MNTIAVNPEKTAEEWKAEAVSLREKARAADARVQESRENSDTDGFLSQWAGGVTASLDRLKAEIADNYGMAEFSALFDLEGNLLPAKLIHGTSFDGYSSRTYWAFLATDDPRGKIQRKDNGKWKTFTESSASTEARRTAHAVKNGVYVGTVLAPAWAKLEGSGSGLSSQAWPVTFRTDGGFSRNVTVLDNGFDTHPDDFDPIED